MNRKTQSQSDSVIRVQTLTAKQPMVTEFKAPFVGSIADVRKSTVTQVHTM